MHLVVVTAENTNELHGHVLATPPTPSFDLGGLLAFVGAETAVHVWANQKFEYISLYHGYSDRFLVAPTRVASWSDASIQSD